MHFLRQRSRDMISSLTLSPRHVLAMKSNLSKALAAMQASNHAKTELYQALEAAVSVRVFDGPSACTQELSRAAEQLRLAVSLASAGDPSAFHVAAAAVSAYHWVWVVATAAATHPELIGQQEREGAALALNLLFKTLVDQLVLAFDILESSSGEPGEPAPEYSPGGKAAMLVAAAAAGAAAAGLLELQDWVREGVVPVDLPTGAQNLEPLAFILAGVAGTMFKERDLADELWVLEEGVLPLVYYAMQQPLLSEAMADALGVSSAEDLGCLKALIWYCEEVMPSVLGTSTDPWLSTKLEPLILVLGLVGIWPGESRGDVFKELDTTSGNASKLAAAALELLEKLWASTGRGNERAERLAWVARAARAAGALCLTCLRGQQEIGGEQEAAGEQGSCGELMATFSAGIPPAVLVAVTAMEQLAAWAAAGTEEQGLQQSIQRHGLQKATSRQLLMLLKSLEYLGEQQHDLAKRLAQRRELAAESVRLAGGPALATILEALARLTGFLAQQRQRGGLQSLGLERGAARLGLEFENGMDSELFGSVVSIEHIIFKAIKSDSLQPGVQSPDQQQQLAQLPEPAQLQSLAHALAARANVLLAHKLPGACSPIVDWKSCACFLAPSLASASLLVLKRSRLDGGSEEDHLRSYSAIGWVLAPVAADLLRLSAEEGHGRGAEHLVEALANLASAGLGDMVARCGGGAVLHLGFEVPEHDVPQRTKALSTLAAVSSPGLCVSFGREGFLERLVGTAAAFAASRQGTVITRSEHLRERVLLLVGACGRLDDQLGTEFLSALGGVDGLTMCLERKLTPELRKRLKQRKLWDEMKTAVVDPLTQRCRELYEEACQQEETCSLRDLAVGRWAGVGCCNPGCCSAGGWGYERKLRTCAGCRVAKFCSQECQKQDWARHKPACRALAQRGSS